MKTPRHEVPAATAPPTRPRGRPRDPARLERILSAARTHFMESGFEGGSMDRIATAADVSKMTLYKYFPSKEALLNATINEPVLRAFDLDVSALDPARPREALLKMAGTYLELILDQEVIAHVRFINASGARNPDLGRSFFESGPDSLVSGLVKYLQASTRTGKLKVDDASMAAEQFAAMVRGNEQLRVVLGLARQRDSSNTRRYCRSCVEVFLRAYGSTNPEPSDLA